MSLVNEHLFQDEDLHLDQRNLPLDQIKFSFSTKIDFRVNWGVIGSLTS